jgi:hypothetical protein
MKMLFINCLKNAKLAKIDKTGAKVLENYEKILETHYNTDYVVKYFATNIEILLDENFIHFSRGNAIKISTPKLNPRYLCDTAESIESTFK